MYTIIIYSHYIKIKITVKPINWLGNNQGQCIILSNIFNECALPRKYFLFSCKALNMYTYLLKLNTF